jgi:outer membrane putative beta-barrel porin/alpha-amylase
LLALVIVVTTSSLAHAQQRPLVTEDPEPVGAGRVLIEGGVDAAHDLSYPVSGLKGNLWRLPTIGISVGISSIAELQIDGGHDRLTIASRNPNAPLASLLTATGESTSDFEDTLVGMKIRLTAESADRPAIAVRFATKLPNASNESGLGLDTTDFFASLLGAKTVQSVRVVGNLGVGILADPTSGNRQNDVLIYGLSFARALTQQTEVVGEINGRASVRNGDPFPGTESRGILKLGGRYTRGALRVDAGVYFGLTTTDPTIGFTAGFTYVFNAFTLP